MPCSDPCTGGLTVNAVLDSSGNLLEGSATVMGGGILGVLPGTTLLSGPILGIAFVPKSLIMNPPVPAIQVVFEATTIEPKLGLTSRFYGINFYQFFPGGDYPDLLKKIDFTKDFVTDTALNTPIVSLKPIPEPSSILLFGSGLAGLAGWRYRKGVKA